MLAMDFQAPLATRNHALSLASIASMLAPSVNDSLHFEIHPLTPFCFHPLRFHQTNARRRVDEPRW
jgi:hypothetical protein